MMRSWCLAVCVGLLLMCEADPARAQRLTWNEDWPRFRPIGYALTGASVLGALAVTFLIPFPDSAGWRGGVLFDNAVRDGLRARDPSVRDAVRLGSDITLAANLVHIGLVDGLIVPLAAGSPDVAAQLSLMNAQAFALNTLFATLLFKAVARQRPLVDDCRREPGSDPLCAAGEYASFPSSHTSTSFTAAGLVCVHHQHLPLYGGPWDTTACLSSLAVAAATGLFRVVGDRHYTTDVLIGALAGFSLGYLYPWLFHYQFGGGAADAPSESGEPAAHASPSNVHWSLLPGAGPGAPYGLSIAGAF